MKKIFAFIYNHFFRWTSYREVRNKILITVLILIVFRFLANIPIPGIDSSALKNAFSGAKGIFDSIDVLAGGTLSRLSIISIGLNAYINASVIFQLLGTVIKKLENLQKEGESGRAKINQWTRMLTVPLAAIQSFAIYNLLKSDKLISADFSTLQLISIIAVTTAGAMILMWLGELITEQGIGNGISFIIMVGIIVKLPGELVNLFSQANFQFPRDYLMFATILAGGIAALLLLVLLYRLIHKIKKGLIRGLLYVALSLVLIISTVVWIIQNKIADFINFQWLNDFVALANQTIKKEPVNIALIFLAVLFVIVLITAFNEGVRKIPIQFARRFRSTKVIEMNSSYIPFRLLIAGVMPIIFASSFLYLPAILYFFFNSSNVGWLRDFVTNVNSFLVTTRWEYWAIYFALVFTFTYFYTYVIFRPKTIAENLRKQGSFIPGVRPGFETEDYLSKLIAKLVLVGALFLGLISILPFFVTNVPGLGGIFSSGTSVLIVVSVILDVRRQIAALRATQNYSKFIDN